MNNSCCSTYLRGLHAAIERGVLKFLALFIPALHHLRHALSGTEVAHEVVFETRKNLLSPGSPCQADRATGGPRGGFMTALGSKHEQAAEFGNAAPPSLISITTTSHVGGDGHGSAMTGAGDDLSLLTMCCRVEHVVRDLLQLEHT
ncbi:MAG: hypothetical protein R3F13_20240 [Prosthecobacter sp.]